MSLVELKNHMMQVKMSSLHALCMLFNQDADLLRNKLNHWMRKGKIRQCTKQPACGSKCFKCPVATTELYEWIDQDKTSYNGLHYQANL